MLKPIALLLLSFWLPLSAANDLKHHLSPYLAMHGDDPVQWRAWGPEVLLQAQKENKLILISSGYFACHWCHVMQRESYQNPAIAKLLNESFIAVKVDRELDVALDALLIRFVQQMNGSAGWPLNVFLTPEGYPLLGLTYRPANEFETLLRRLTERWLAAPKQLSQMAQMASTQIFKSSDQVDEQPLRPVAELRQDLVQQALKLADEFQGGFGEQSKFPRVPMLQALLAELQREPNPELQAFLQLTLEQMSLPIQEEQQTLGLLPVTIEHPEALARELKMDFELLQEQQGVIGNKLYRWRLQNRSLPTDGKRLAGWNGLALSALCQAAVLPAGARFRPAAQKQLNFVQGFWSGDRLKRDGRWAVAIAIGTVIEDQSRVVTCRSSTRLASRLSTGIAGCAAVSL